LHGESGKKTRGSIGKKPCWTDSERHPATGASLSAQTNGGTFPAGLTFGSINDVSVGQSVLLDSTGFTPGTGTALRNISKGHGHAGGVAIQRINQRVGCDRSELYDEQFERALGR
jgi:hypothetical protein